MPCCCCNGNRCLEGFFGGSAIVGVALEQHFAARAMQFCFERAVAQAIRRRERFVERGDGAIGIARSRFDVGQRDLQ